jgi:hypothetical protein
MAGYAGTTERTVFLLGEVRARILVFLLAVLLAMFPISWSSIADSNERRGDFSTLIAIGGTRVHLACQGNGPATVAIVNEASLTGVIDDAVQARLARSVRLCTVTMAEAVSRSSHDLITLLPVTLFGQKLPEPFVIISLASISSAFDDADDRPFNERLAGFVLINPSPAPGSGLVARADGSNWPLPMDDTGETVLAILSLFWPTDEV